MAITLSGTEVFLRDLERMIPSDTNVDAALAEGAGVIAREMRRLAPVKSGKLKSAIKVGKARNGRNGRQVTVGIHRRDFSGDDYYPAYVEYGHAGPRKGSPRTPPHPFIRPAFDLKKDEAWSIVKQAVIDQMNAKGL